MLDGPAFRTTIDRLADLVGPDPFDLVAGIEARGFVFAAALAYKLGCGTLMLRKSGKLPAACVGVDYALEYGSDRLEMHADACAAGSRVLLVDDLLATGGTALAAAELLRGAGAALSLAAFVIDLPDLGGARRLSEAAVEPRSLIAFLRALIGRLPPPSGGLHKRAARWKLAHISRNRERMKWVTNALRFARATESAQRTS